MTYAQVRKRPRILVSAVSDANGSAGKWDRRGTAIFSMRRPIASRRDDEEKRERGGHNPSRNDVDLWLTARSNLSHDDTERNETISGEQR